MGSPQVETAGKFAANGPLLPIEFCRISSDGRLTLAIDETFGALCKTYSAPSGLTDLDAAIDNLRAREGMSSARAVGFVETASGRQSRFAAQSHPQAVATIGAWAESLGYDAAIWTALGSNFDDGARAASRSPSLRRSNISKLWKAKSPRNLRTPSSISAKRRPRSRRRCATKSQALAE